MIYDYNSPKIELFIHKQLIKCEPVEETKINKVLRRSLKILTTLLAFGARVPYFKVSLAYSNTWWGYVLGAGSGGSFGCVLTWCFLNMIDDKLRPLSIEEKQLLQSPFSKKCRFISTIAQVVTGIFAKIPFAYVGYYYNNRKWYVPAVILAVDSVYTIYSLNLATEKLLKSKGLPEQEKKLNSLRVKLISKLERAKTALAVLLPEERTKCLKKFNKIKDSSLSSGQSAAKYLELLFTQSKEVKIPPEKKIVKVMRVLPVSTYSILTLSQMIFFGVLAFRASQIFFDSNASNMGVALFVVMCNFFLSLQLTKTTSMNMYEGTVDRLKGSHHPSLAGSLRPGLQTCLKVLSVAIAALAYAGPYQVCADNFSGKFKIYMQVTSIIATVFTSVTAMFDLIDDLILYGSSRCNKKEHKMLIELDSRIKSLLNVIKECPLVDFLQIVDCLPQDKYNKWLKKLDINKNDIEKYLEVQL